MSILSVDFNSAEIHYEAFSRQFRYRNRRYTLTDHFRRKLIDFCLTNKQCVIDNLYFEEDANYRHYYVLFENNPQYYVGSLMDDYNTNAVINLVNDYIKTYYFNKGGEQNGVQ